MTQTPEQPDGIADDSTDLPDPVRAAERVNAFLAWFGDGLVGEGDDTPLYARDLQALANLATRDATVREFCADRAEYITAINNCHPDNVVDYWRWNGHAEARRQLSERLGLPTAWPATAQEGPAA